MSSTWTGQFVCEFTIVYVVQSPQHGAKGVASPGRHSHMLLCLAEAIKVQRAPVPTLQGEWYLSSLIKNICCAHARLLSLPPLSPKGILPHPPSLRKQQIFLIIYFFPPPACLFVCQQVIKICLLLPRRSTLVETAAAEPRSWSPLLHADELNMKKRKTREKKTTTGNHSLLNTMFGLFKFVF